MKIVKNLSKANIRHYEGFEVREDLNFSDDGNYFRGFSYKGMPITTCRSGEYVYLAIRVDYLYNEFTFGEWHKTEESKLCDKFNGVKEFDMDELIENLEKVIAKVDEMNEVAGKEEIDMTAVKAAIANEIVYAENVIENFKKNFKWYESSIHSLKNLVEYLHCVERNVKEVKVELENIDDMSRKKKQMLVEMLTNHGYAKLNKDGFYLKELVNAVTVNG